MRYVDFVVQIGPESGPGYRVRVESPEGEGSGYFHLPEFPGSPPDTDPLTQWSRAAVVRQVSRELDDEDDTPTGDREAGDPAYQRIGALLFDALFAGVIGTHYAVTLARMRDDPNCSLRLKLKLDMIHGEGARLADLPWEFLYSSKDCEFLGRQRRLSIVRYLDVPKPPRPRQLLDVLRILVVASSPSSHEALDLTKEREDITKALRGGRLPATVTFVDRASLKGLAKELGRFAPHVVHFMGHGGFRPDDGRGFLCFEASDGSVDEVEGQSLAEELAHHPSIQLVVLNACSTARVTRETGRNPFLGVATALVRQGLPAVVAMRQPIEDPSAIAFSRQFYRSLARGSSIDLAMVEGRQAIYHRARHSPEWGIPVLFMRGSESEPFIVRRRNRRLASLLLVLALVSLASFTLPAFVASWTAPEHAVVAPPPRDRSRSAAITLLDEPAVEAVEHDLTTTSPMPLVHDDDTTEATPARRPSSGSHHRTATGIDLRYVRQERRDDDFWIGETEVSQKLWWQIMGTRPSRFRFKDKADARPVEKVSWFDALRFANRLSSTEGLTPCYRLTECRQDPVTGESCSVDTTSARCAGYRLPSVSEWRTAALAGGRGPFASGDHLSSSQANFAWDKDPVAGPSEDTPPPYSPLPVGVGRQPNRWQIHDMHGNVWEWVWPDRRSGKSMSVLGGAYNSTSRECQVGAEHTVDAGRSYKDVGFRIVKGARHE